MSLSPKDRFRNGIRRIVRIVKSFKSSALTQLLDIVQQKIKKKVNLKESKRKTLIMKSPPTTIEQRNEHSLIQLTDQVEELKTIVVKQSKMISILMEKLLPPTETVTATTAPANEQ